MSIDPFAGASEDAPVLVVVLNNLEDFHRAQAEGWYRIPLVHAPPRIGADYLAFYQTAAFPPEDRWCVRWVAPLLGYRLATRRELIPSQPEHPRADARYYRVALGKLLPLPRRVPSRRLRRITFIQTIMKSLCEAEEINDLWQHTPAQNRLWQALQQAGLAQDAEHAYPLDDDLDYTADVAVFSGQTRFAITLAGPRDNHRVAEVQDIDYLLARGGWRALSVDPSELASIHACIHTLQSSRIGQPEKD